MSHVNCDQAISAKSTAIDAEELLRLQKKQTANVAAARLILDYFSNGETEKALDLISDEVRMTFFNPPGVKIDVDGLTAKYTPWVWPAHGKQEFLRNVKEFDEMVEITEWDSLEITPLGEDRVYILAYYEAKVLTTGKAYRCNTAKIMRFKHNKLVHLDSSHDSTSMMQAFLV